MYPSGHGEVAVELQCHNEKRKVWFPERMIRAEGVSLSEEAASVMICVGYGCRHRPEAAFLFQGPRRK